MTTISITYIRYLVADQVPNEERDYLCCYLQKTHLALKILLLFTVVLISAKVVLFVGVFGLQVA